MSKRSKVQIASIMLLVLGASVGIISLSSKAGVAQNTSIPPITKKPTGSRTMTDEDLKRLLDRPTGRPLGAIQMRVAVHRPESIGASPTVGIVSGAFGFDWNHGQFILVPDTELTTLNSTQVDEITASVRAGHSWHAYQEEKKLRRRITDLESQLTKLCNRVDQGPL